MIDVDATMVDDVTPLAVQFSVDGLIIATRPGAPARYTWDTSTVSAVAKSFGSHSHYVAARAFDAEGNPGPWTISVVDVAPSGRDVLPPAVRFFLYPFDGTAVGRVTVEVHAADESGFGTLELTIGGARVGVTEGSPVHTMTGLQFKWDTAAYPNGIYLVTARARDAAGNVSTTQRTVIVANAGTPTPSSRPFVLWFNQTTRQSAIWELSGRTVTATRTLDRGVPAPDRWTAMGAGDLNADGAAEIVWRHSGGLLAESSMNETQVAAWRTLQLPDRTAPRVDPAWQLRGVGDLNGDGCADIVWQHVDGRLAAWFMNGFIIRETVRLSVPSVADTNWQIASAGDVDGDGKADIVWQHTTSGALAAWLMDGANVRATHLLSANVSHDTNWRVSGVTDVNGDGRADLLWQHPDGRLGVWYLRGFEVTYTNYLSIDSVADRAWKVVGPG